MTDIGNIASTLTTFLLQPDKDWSVASYQFFAVFIIFYIIYIGVCKTPERCPLIRHHIQPVLRMESQRSDDAAPSRHNGNIMVGHTRDDAHQKLPQTMADSDNPH